MLTREQENGRVIWITGLSGAGKTTIAQEVVGRIRGEGRCCVQLDGDKLRWAIGDPNAGHDRRGRILNAYRICRLARMLAEDGHLVVVSTMSLFHEIHEWNRQNLPGYLEVYIQVDLAVLKERDPKGIYQAGHRGADNNVVGLNLDPEEPQQPHLVVNNNGHREDLGELAELILDRAKKQWESTGVAP